MSVETKAGLQAMTAIICSVAFLWFVTKSGLVF